MSARRFPPPWTVENIGAAFVVKDSAGQKLAYVYFEDEPGAFNTTAMSRTRLSAAVQLGLHFEVAGSHREWGSCREECQDRVSPTRPPQCRVDQ
jgi:hypothetical protein